MISSAKSQTDNEETQQIEQIVDFVVSGHTALHSKSRNGSQNHGTTKMFACQQMFAGFDVLSTTFHTPSPLSRLKMKPIKNSRKAVGFGALQKHSVDDCGFGPSPSRSGRE